MMRIKYGTAIEESEEELREVEQHWRGQKSADRVRLLRLLKSGRVKSLKEGAPVVGYSLPQVKRCTSSIWSLSMKDALA
jgi:hypothetical protein